MRKLTALIFATALLGTANAQASLVIVDADMLRSCPFVVGPQNEPSDTVEAAWCAKTVFKFMFENGMVPESNEESVARVQCGATILIETKPLEQPIHKALATFADRCLPAAD